MHRSLTYSLNISYSLSLVECDKINDLIRYIETTVHQNKIIMRGSRRNYGHDTQCKLFTNTIKVQHKIFIRSSCIASTMQYIFEIIV